MRIVENNAISLFEALAPSFKASCVCLRDVLARANVSWFAPLSDGDIGLRCLQCELYKRDQELQEYSSVMKTKNFQAEILNRMSLMKF